MSKKDAKSLRDMYGIAYGFALRVVRTHGLDRAIEIIENGIANGTVRPRRLERRIADGRSLPDQAGVVERLAELKAKP